MRILYELAFSNTLPFKKMGPAKILLQLDALNDIVGVVTNPFTETI
jgi:hypothetical protein